MTELLSPRQRRGWRMALALTLLRLGLAIPFTMLGQARRSGWTPALLLVVGFLSDVFDGVVARRHLASTEGLRRLDSAVDSAFYLAVAWAAWRIAPEAFRANAVGVTLVLTTMALNYGVEWIRFRREGSYHARTARLFGITLFAALFTVLGSGDGVLIPVAVACGLLSHAENLAITLTLPAWQHDVPSLAHAIRIRRSRTQPT